MTNGSHPHPKQPTPKPATPPQKPVTNATGKPVKK